MVNPIQQLHALGQSLWYDNIQRRMLLDGEMARLIQAGEVRGMTSNPSIFNQAISKSMDYDSDLFALAWSGLTAGEIFDQLAVKDIQLAADLFSQLYQQSEGQDGFISLEVNPTLADDTEATIAEALRLWGLVQRPNLMVKIPATRAGIPAIERCIAQGLNINVTLIFSLERYAEVMAAYQAGLEQRRRAGQPLERVASVASFFVSRLDTKVDQRLEEIVRREGPEAQLASSLLGKAGIANARLAYARFLAAFDEAHFGELRRAGARLQRPLWASTSTKNPAYRDVMYVEELIGPNTVNTMPPVTMEAFRAHGEVRAALTEGLEQAQAVMESLEQLGISIEQVTQELEEEGVAAFANAFAALLDGIEKRRQAAQAQLGPLAAVMPGCITRLLNERFPQRLCARDVTLWSGDPSEQREISERLGWIDLPQSSRSLSADLKKWAQEIRLAGFEQALLLGMGGSSLAPEVLSEVFGAQDGGLALRILDSTDPAQVSEAEQWTRGAKTLFIVASKSGGTAEVNAFFDFFWEKTQASTGTAAGGYFVAITDPGTSLEQLARLRGFRRVILADPTVGGRNSALSAFGLAPAALLGLDAEVLLARAERWMLDCQPGRETPYHPAVVLGAVIGEANRQGRDKLTIIADSRLASLGAWLEQLVAESSGKRDAGIIPVDGEPLVAPKNYGADRLFVYLQWDGSHAGAVEKLRESGQPVLTLQLADLYDLGGEFYRWEIATAVACALIGVNSFDQPDVQDSKNRTKARIAEYRQAGSLAEGTPVWEGQGVRLFGQLPAPVSSLKQALEAFLGQARPGDYVALNAYLPRSAWAKGLLQQIRGKILVRRGVATTVGFGPRFLHSTGQLHKGGPDTGLFLQITAEPAQDLEIPGEGLTFGMLERAQAMGDFEALVARNRRCLRVHLEAPEVLERLVDLFE